MRMKMLIKMLLSILLGLTVLSITYASNCHPLLWPSDNGIQHPSSATVAMLDSSAHKILNKPVHPVTVLKSAGIIKKDDARLQGSREAFKDADNAALLALAYIVTKNAHYLDKAKNILVAWARINQPTGHPIDETRLSGMIWAFDLIACHLSADDKVAIKNWFEHIRLKKIAWKPGSVTNINNHRIHHLKLLLLLDKVLGKKISEDDLKKYSKLNIDNNGISFDYMNRDALYYHNYVLQPWLEISLISGCCNQRVGKAFYFLSQKILSDDIDNEFVNSQARIDNLRANAGFSYTKGKFDVTKAAPTIIAWYTLNSAEPDKDLWVIQSQAKSSAWLTFLRARRELWHTPASLT